MKHITLKCTFEYDFMRKRYIFTDKDGFYYLWQLDFSEYGLTIDITALRQNDDDFITVDNPRVEMLILYLKDILETKNSTFVVKFFDSINDFEFQVEEKYIATFGENFCNAFLVEQDNEFIYRDKYAKHPIIDFEKIKTRELLFFKQPKLLPLYISEVGVQVTKEAKLLKDSKEIDIETFWTLYDEYKFILIQEIKQKDTKFLQIEKELKNCYKQTLKQLEREKIDDYEVEAYICVFDGFLNEYAITKIIFPKQFYKLKERYSLAHYGLNIEVHSIMQHLVDTFCIEVAFVKLHFWIEVKVRKQKFFDL